MDDLISKIMALYAELDEKVSQFQRLTGLQCPFGCGLCCPTATVDATVLEMLPAAAEILRQGTESYWLERIAEAETRIGCVLYADNRADNAPGHCGFYPWRASVCRLFGFAAVRTRDGSSSLAVCKHLKIANPDMAKYAAAHADQAPMFSDIGAILYALDPALGSHVMPITEALGKAIQRLGLALQMKAASKC
jgi:uncharacterized protein